MSTGDTTAKRQHPVGVLDSGVGGLSILAALRDELPHEHFLYVADQAHLPYGPRPLDEIRTFVTAITRFLLEHDAKLIVVACNAASAAGLFHLRESFPGVPFVGMEPAVKPAAQATRSGVIAVLTTAATADGPLYARVVQRHAANVQVETIVCPELVTAIEANQTDLAALRPLLASVLDPALERGADQIVLGCTHFPFVAAAIGAYAGPDVAVIDPSAAVARQTHRLLAQHALLAGDNAISSTPAYYTTGDSERFAALVENLVGGAGDVTPLHWQKGNPRTGPA
ncbi:MAG: glutamate racemase [Anaerolineae bacterium]|nr:glutamate racemase [Anaerolineae bacterium]